MSKWDAALALQIIVSVNLAASIYYLRMAIKYRDAWQNERKDL